MAEKSENQARIEAIEQAMEQPDFWSDPQRAQGLIKELQELKDSSR